MEYRIIELLKEIKGMLTNNPNKDWMDINQASKYTNISPSTLRRNVRSGSLKASRRTGKLLFKQFELERWLTGGRNA